MDAKKIREDSVKEGSTRNVGGTMGKNDFLMLLSAQLRYQDPLNPQNDSDFAAQLAQFSSLEQMQNMNETLSSVANYQAYSLVGKYVVASAYVDGVLSDIPGIVDSIFTRKGITYAQIGEYVVPISSITDVFDASALLTPESLIQTSNNLIGREVKAQSGDKVIEGVVTRITVEKGVMYARIDDGTDTPKFVQVGAIFDIRQPGTPGDDKPVFPPNPAIPPDAKYFKPDGDGFIETDSTGTIELGRWEWNPEKNKWILTELKKIDPDEPPGADEPPETDDTPVDDDPPETDDNII
jgi:flagellar hook assembly protein FlgD